jgi:hypothetical protein
MGLSAGLVSDRNHFCSHSGLSQAAGELILVLDLRPLSNCEGRPLRSRAWRICVIQKWKSKSSFWRVVASARADGQAGPRYAHGERAPSPIALVVGGIVSQGVLIAEFVNDISECLV